MSAGIVTPRQKALPPRVQEDCPLGLPANLAERVGLRVTLQTGALGLGVQALGGLSPSPGC